MGNVYAYNNQLWRETQRFEYTGSPQQFTLQPGRYLIQCHGGKGGKTSTNNFNTLGGSSFGILELTEMKTLYAYVGGDGTQGSKGIVGKGGYNGGADGGLGYDNSYYGGSGGGGASDIRVKRREDFVNVIPNIPEGYQQIEYVETNGSQYIDLGELVHEELTSVTFTKPQRMQLDYFCNGNSVIEFDCILNTPVNNYDTPWGSREGSSLNNDYFIAYNGGMLRYSFSGVSGNVGDISNYYGKRIKIILSKSYCKLEHDGETVYNVLVNGGDTSTNVAIGIATLFTNNSGEDYSECRANVVFYGLRIYENDELIKEYIPFKDDTTDRYCVKETQSDTLFYSIDTDITGNINRNNVAFGFRSLSNDSENNMVIVGSRYDQNAGNRFDIHFKTQPSGEDQPLIPVMTSTTSPSGKIENGGYYGYGSYGTLNPWRAFDGDTSTQLQYQQEGVQNGWLSYEFPRTYMVNKITALFGNYLSTNRITATLYVYDENDNETLIDTVTVTGYNSGSYGTYDFTVHQYVKKFKFVFGYKESATNIMTYEIQAYGTIAPPGTLLINSVYGNETDQPDYYISTTISNNEIGRYMIYPDSVYVNDNAINKSASSGLPGTNPFYLFACYQKTTYDGVDPSSYFKGKLYNFRIYDTITGDDINLGVYSYCPYYFDYAVACQYEGRYFYKLTNGPALGCLVHQNGWTTVTFFSKNPEDCRVTVQGYGTLGYIEMTYKGETWYYSQSGYGFSGDYDDALGNLPTYPFPVTATWDDSAAEYSLILDYIYDNWGINSRILKKELIPCIRNSDQSVGLIDTISGEFYTSSGDDLIAGPVGSYAIPDDLITDNIYDIRSLNTRIIVAGGAGGGSNDTPYYPSHALNYTGIGGGIVGGCISSNTNSSGKYASQTTGYSFGSGETPSKKTGGYNGASGGGGGWYGGYAISETSGSYCSGNGSGGSGYVLTESSYKPEGYGVNEDMTPFYMTSPFMNSGTAIEPFVSISVPLVNILDNDTIIIYPTGSSQSFQLSPGQYQLKCWGGDGGVQGTTIGATRGGYSEGILSLGTVEQCHVYVGGTGLYDCLISQEYVYQLKPDLSWNGGGMAPALGDYGLGRSGGGATDIRIGSDSLYSRIIVAGGSGGTNDGGFGGNGGGETGGTANGSNGYNQGPGTQTNTGVDYPQYPDVQGGFGYGGDAGVNSGYHGGAGGSGWFGGGGTYPSTYGSQRSGAGGSGYVLTESSYKPEGYLLDESYYLSNAQTYDGANDLPYGITRAEIIALRVLNYRVLCRDQYGIKYWAEDLNRWALLPSQELTQSNFETYGVFTITSDTGLADTYEVLIYDPEDVVEKVLANITPKKQTITNTTITTMPIRKMTPEVDVDTSIFDVDIKAERKITSTNIKITTTITIDKKQRSDKIPKLYYIIYSDQ